nr:sodefrin precursor-like factor C [Lithobates vaillanti]
MNKVFVFLIMSGLVNTGQMTTTCNSCWTIDSTTCCDERDLQCDGSGCMTLSEYTVVDGEEYRTIQKGCSVPLLCDKCFSVTTKDNFLVRVGSQCGEGEGSNENLNYKDICTDQLKPNNYHCPSCFSIGSPTDCESTGYVDCLGLEMECFNYGAFVMLSDGRTMNVSLKGCITIGGCDIGYAGVPGNKELKRDHMICTPAIKKEENVV